MYNSMVNDPFHSREKEIEYFTLVLVVWVNVDKLLLDNLQLLHVATTGIDLDVTCIIMFTNCRKPLACCDHHSGELTKCTFSNVCFHFKYSVNQLHALCV